MAELLAVPCVKFDILLPASYTSPQNGQSKPLQLADVVDRLQELTTRFEKFGGYTISNPSAPPPLAGGYLDEPQEKNLFLSLIIPDNEVLHEAQELLLDLVAALRRKYNQKEILTLSYSVQRYVRAGTFRKPSSKQKGPDSQSS